jgi:hypothetical protein
MLNQNSDKSPKVTISLFSRELGPDSFGTQLFEQVENIKIISEKITEAAKSRGHPPPEIVVSILLIPDWKKNNNGYENPDYLNTKKLFFKAVQEKFGHLDVKIEDFYQEGLLTAAEKAYMHQLEVAGSNADIIKTRAIINNKLVKHLQMDSNTIIKDYDLLYQHTFGMTENDQKDGLNACFYRSGNADAHNKIVYTTPSGKIARALEEIYEKYVAEHQNDANDKKPGRNSIYDFVFSRALCTIGLTYDNVNVAGNYHFYPAAINAPEYHMTSDIVTAINMSWASASATDLTSEALKKIIPWEDRDAKYDFQSFVYIIKKYTGFLSIHATDNLSPHDFYESLLTLSDNENDMKILANFYKHVATCNLDLLGALAKVFPNTAKGNLLTSALFGCSVPDLHTNPKLGINDDLSMETHEYVSNLLKLDEEMLNDYTKRKQGYLTSKAFQKLVGKPLNTVELESGSDEAKIYNFFLALEMGDVETQFLSTLKAMDGFDGAMKKKIFDEAKRILEHSCDKKWHFNYIPNRGQALEILHTFARQMDQSEASVFRPLYQEYEHSNQDKDSEGSQKKDVTLLVELVKKLRTEMAKIKTSTQESKENTFTPLYASTSSIAPQKTIERLMDAILKLDTFIKQYEIFDDVGTEFNKLKQEILASGISQEKLSFNIEQILEETENKLRELNPITSEYTNRLGK